MVACITATPAPLSLAAYAPSAIPAGLTGRYILEENDRFLDLRPDGTFSLSAGTTSSAGTYAVNGTEVNLTIPGAKLPQFQFSKGSLTIRGVKLPRVGDAAPPPAPGAVTGPAIASEEKVNATRSIINVKMLHNAARLWSINHQGKFPDSLEQLLTKEYAGTDPRVLRCPLLQDDNQVGYVYLGKGLTDSAPEGTVLILSKWHDADNKRIVGHANGSVALELPKLADIPASMRGPVSNLGAATPGVANRGAATPPAANAGATTPALNVIPPNLPKITLSANDNGKGRYGAIFPLGQMPADLRNYFWVTDRPDNKFNVTALQQNTWFVSTLPGIYKVRVEYRSGTARQQVSNLVEVTVPDTGQAPPTEASARAATAAAIPPEQAGAHIGEVKTVEGIPSSVESGNKGKIYLNFGGKYPNQVFAAFVSPVSKLAFDDLKPLEGTKVRITGKIIKFNGGPQIIIEKRSQIEP